MKNTPLHAADAPAEAGCVLIVDDHQRTQQSMADILRSAGYAVRTSASAVEALRIAQQEPPDVIVTDLKMPGMDGLEFIRRLKQVNCDAQVVMVTAYASVETAVEAMRHGAFDYLEKPLRAEALEQLVARAMRHAALCDVKTAVAPGDGAAGVMMVGQSRAMQTLRQRIAQAAPTAETVLITGESGTGKELVARSIHALSRRAGAALVSLNCPVLAAPLMESELFGHERGAFTSADAPRVGRFELADGGTILLDEITEIDLPLQAKLLRVLQEKSFERIGSSRTIRVDVRVVATTNRDLLREVREGRFREDLYYRLAVLPIQVPPLRERLEDIPDLTDHFLWQAARRLGREPCRLDDAARELLIAYHWPGNVRELENLITRASVLSETGRIDAAQIRPWLIEGGAAAPHAAPGAEMPPVAVGLSLEEMERKLITATLERFAGHRAKTAAALGIGIRTLCGKLRSYGLAPRAKSFSEAA